MLSGPPTPPEGAIVVPAGDNSHFSFTQEGATYWFAPGIHTLGTDIYDQIIPANNSTFVGGPGAILDGQSRNQYAFTQHATGVTIRYLTIRNFNCPRDQGVINHDSGTGWTIEYVTARNNKGGAVFLGSNNTLRYGCLQDNGQYGFQVYSAAGPDTVLMDHNEIAGNNADRWDIREPGCGCSGGGKFWNARNVTVTNNYVHDNLGAGLWADTDNVGFDVENNYISENYGEGFFYEISYNALIKNNTFIRNALYAGPRNRGFPTGAIYLSESGGDARVANTNGYSTIEIANNTFTDNWSGVVLWENADRFCGSPANTSTGYCTLVNPEANFTTCKDPAEGGKIDMEPYYSDCRWKTQNVSVHDNIFNLTKSNIDRCATTVSCGLQGIFSNYGTYPDWSPYMGFVVADAIIADQNDYFFNNQYTGEWNFMVHDTSLIVDFPTWQAAPYGQDAGSVTNVLDGDTATLEGSIGQWKQGKATRIADSTLQANSGTRSLLVKMTTGNGWAVRLASFPGFAETPGDKTISFWGVRGLGDNLGVTMRVRWYDAAANLLQTDQVTIATLTQTWSNSSAVVTAPSATATVFVDFTGSGAAGNTVYLDDIFVSQ